MSAFWAFRNIDRGWIPHDEGTLAQSAERILDGQLPHRDFDELYTGGLSALNAVAFEFLGMDLLTPRLVLFVFFLAWVPAVFYVCSRFATLPVSALATLLAVSWSIPNYPAAMPSWYNLFFATFGLAAILRYLEKPRRRWLFLAGLAGGLSVLVKTSGLFFVAAGLLFLAYREQEVSGDPGGEARPAAVRAGRGFSILSSTLLLIFAALLSRLVTSEGAGAAAVLRFIVPLGATAGFLIWSEWNAAARLSTVVRLRNLMRSGLPFLAGVLTPLAGLVSIYAYQGALGDLARGLFTMPVRRLQYAAYTPPGFTTLWVALPLLVVLFLDRIPSVRFRWAAAAVVVLAGALVAVSPSGPRTFPFMWSVLNAVGPLVALGGSAWLVVHQIPSRDSLRSQRTLAAVAVAGGAMLIQFPFSGPIYLFYALPALLPAALALTGREPISRRPVAAAVLVFLLLFSVRWTNSGILFHEGHLPYDPTSATARLDLPRGGGLRVSPDQKEEYEKLVAAMQELSTSRYAFATPDLPEVYFLSGLRNPTRTLFDFFDEPAGRTGRIVRALDAHRVDVVVLNRRLRFSGPPPDTLLKVLRKRYPRAAVIGDFILRWRGRGVGAPTTEGTREEATR